MTEKRFEIKIGEFEEENIVDEKRLFVGRKKCEDRFTIITNYDGEIGVKENRSGDVLVLKHSDLDAQQFVAQLVVFLNDQNQAIVDLYDGNRYWSDKATEKIKELEKENEQLKEENKELKERNNRQCKQLDDLFKLIEQKDWRALSDIMDDFQKAEEQLQREWRTYE